MNDQPLNLIGKIGWLIDFLLFSPVRSAVKKRKAILKRIELPKPPEDIYWKHEIPFTSAAQYMRGIAGHNKSLSTEEALYLLLKFGWVKPLTERHIADDVAPDYYGKLNLKVLLPGWDHGSAREYLEPLLKIDLSELELAAKDGNYVPVFSSELPYTWKKLAEQWDLSLTATEIMKKPTD